MFKTFSKDPKNPVTPSERIKLVTIYGVPWIEVEFGQREQGFKLFTNKEHCISSTLEDSKNGSYDGGYIGPERPLYYYEIPFSCLDKGIKSKLKLGKGCFTEDNFKPKFKSDKIYIK